MCSIQDHDFQRPLHQLDVLDVSEQYQLPFDFCQAIYLAMTDSEVPELATFVLIIEGIKRFGENSFGTNQNYGPWIPLSAISLDEDFVRYRTPAMQVFHDAFVAFNMSQRNRGLVNKVLEKKGIQLVTMHSCGIVIVPVHLIADFMESKLHKARNFLRSRANSMGTSIVLVDSFENIPITVDMGKSEFFSYYRAWEVLINIPNRETKHQITEALDFLKTNLNALTLA
jgi:hypothetical protein